MNWSFYLDGNKVEEPGGFEDFQEEIIRDERQRVIRTDLPIELTFYGEGYDYINGVYQENYDSEIRLDILKQNGAVTEPYLIAIIKLSNCEFNLSRMPKQHVTVEVDDSVYQARIFSNFKRPVGVGGNKTLNDFPIDPITPVDLTVYTVAAGSNLPTTRKAYDLKDALTYAFDFVSDNKVQFESTWYDNLPDDEKYVLVTGVELRDPGNDETGPVIVLEEILDNFFRLHNLYLICENDLNNPTVRLETEDYLHGDEVSASFKALPNVARSMDYERLYNVILVGDESAIIEYGTNFSFFYLQFLSFAPEKYNVKGFINADRQLDLTVTREFIIDNNAIADAIENDSDTNDDKVFIIQYDSSTDTAAKNPNFPSIDPDNRFYNEQLMNSAVLNRYNLLGQVALDSGLLDASFLAEQTNDIILNTFISSAGQLVLYDENAVPFNDDSTPPNFDTGSNYNTTTFEFTAPVSGAYRMEFAFVYALDNFDTPDARQSILPTMSFRKNDNENITPIQLQVFNYSGGEVGSFIAWRNNGTSVILGGIQSVSAQFYILAEQTITLDEGDTVTGRLRLVSTLDAAPAAPVPLQARIIDSTFSNPTTPISGGVYDFKDPDEYYVGMYKMNDIFISDEQFDAIKNGLTKMIIFDTGNNDPRKAYISNIKRNVITGNADMELIFNRKQVNY